MESHKRSIAKTCSWRFFATVITTGVVYLVSTKLVNTDKAQFAALIGILDTTIKFGAYFFHERVWNKIDYGRMPPQAGEFEI